MEHTRNRYNTHIFLYTRKIRRRQKKKRFKYDTFPPPSSYITQRDTGGEQMVKKKVKKKTVESQTHFSNELSPYLTTLKRKKKKWNLFIFLGAIRETSP